MIIHIAQDEKVIDAVIEQFELLNEPAIFYICVSDKKQPLRYVKSKYDYIKIREIARAEDMQEMIDAMNNSDFTFVHCLNNEHGKLVNACNSNVKIVWGLFGYEVYSLPEFWDFVAPLEFIPRLKVRFDHYKERIGYFLRFLLRKKGYFYKKEMYNSFQRANYIAACFDNEVSMIKKRLNLGCKHIQWYYPFVSNIKFNLALGNDILLGNSASHSNNHYDVLLLLSKVNLKDRRVIVPLSYGDASYREQVIKWGNVLIPNNFYPVVDFMPYQQYFDLLSNCGFVIMNHTRQQGVGNIIAALKMGAKLFLRKTTIFDKFKSLGIEIFKISDIQATDELNEALPIAIQEKNRGIIESFYSEKDAILFTKEMIKQVRADS